MSDRDVRAPTPATVLRDTIRYAGDAMALFDRVVERLGERAFVQSCNGRASRAVFVRTGPEGRFIIPWPLLSVAFDESLASDEPEPTPEPAPIDGSWRIDLGSFRPVPGHATLRDGPVTLTVNYRADRRWKDTSAGADPSEFASLVGALSQPSADRLGALVEYITTLDIGRHGPARVLCPVARAGGVEGIWSFARQVIREALFDGRIPIGAAWVVVDGYVGSVLSVGASREAALATWRAAVERVRPKPPPPPESTYFPPPDGGFEPTQWTGDESADAPMPIEIRVRGWDAPPFDSRPAATPAALVPIASIAPVLAARGINSRWLGDYGSTQFALRSPTPDGFVLIGDRLRDRFEPATIGPLLDAADRAAIEGYPSTYVPPAGSSPDEAAMVMYRCVDERTGRPIPPAHGGSQSARFDARGFDGGSLASFVVRVRRST